MATLAEVLGVFACLFPVVALIAYMAWATRRKRCPHCGKLVASEAENCTRCGQSMGPSDKSSPPTR